MDDSEYSVAEAATLAHSAEDTRSQLLQQLENAKLELIESYQNATLENAQWIANSERRDDILQLVEEVKFTGKFGFGVFRDPSWRALP